MIKGIYIENYKIFKTFETEFKDDLNILVGDNETGKSTILEAINLVLTKKLNDRYLEFELSPYLFNTEVVNDYVAKLNNSGHPGLPKIIIELILEENDEVQDFRGANNHLHLDAIGLRLEVSFDEDFKEEYEKFIEEPSKVKTIPTEFYSVKWKDFGGNSVTQRGIPIHTSLIDATTIRLQNGADYYLHNIIDNGLNVKEKAELAILYRQLKEDFLDEDSIKSINSNLAEEKSIVDSKELSVSIDISAKSSWETSIVPQLDDIPFTQAGKGEQNSLKIMLALNNKASNSNIVLIEEPENHLSFSSMNKLISRIKEKCSDKQIFITTHSAYVLNKLGMENLKLIRNQKVLSLNELSKETFDYFKKLSGYDTLRLILAKKAILVEGPSDELIVQKAYLHKYGKLPIEDGIDVINIRGLSFLRFIEIAEKLEIPVHVVTDNDKDYEKNIKEKYREYGDSKYIKVFSSDDNILYTLECHIVQDNELETLNSVFGTTYDTKEALQKSMTNNSNKTDYAIKIFDSEDGTVELPEYINKAIEFETGE